VTSPIGLLPELAGTGSFVRIPPELDVPITDRVRALIDTPAMQRLKEISQLGLVSLVYPGAVHSRFEHSLGVYRLACMALRHLLQAQPEMMSEVSEADAKVFLLGALLHDLGHWPYCHPIEDMRLEQTQRHEKAARQWIVSGLLAEAIEHLWNIPPQAVADFLSRPSQQRHLQLLQNILNGPVDIDKMDYLQRDSLHAGVPYGRNFDTARLISALRFTESSQMTITSKGKTAAEMMVFSRYVMFSEVYWHHSVRSATAMLQRLVYRLQDQIAFESWAEMSDAQFQQSILTAASHSAELRALAQSLFGRERRLYKRFCQFNFAVSPAVHAALAHRPFEQLLRCSERLTQHLSRIFNTSIGSDEILIDAPPVKLEIQFKLDIFTAQGHQSLADVSPVVKALATDQFDKFVKQVRVFVHPDRRQQLQLEEHQLAEILLKCVDD
jgi:uncharacterized protein